MTKFYRSFVCAVFIASAFVTALAYANTSSLEEFSAKLLQGIEPVVFSAVDDPSSFKIAGSGEFSNTEIFAEKDRFTSFMRVSVSQKGEKSWDVTAQRPSNSMPIQKDDWVVATFYVRAADGSEQANVKGYIERFDPSWMLVSDASVAASTEWTRVVAVGQAPQDLPKNSIHLSLHLASEAQTLDLAELSFFTLPAQTPAHIFPPTELKYSGMDQNAPWRAEAAKMIEQFRTDEFTVFILNRDGSPAANKSVEIALGLIGFSMRRRHAFIGLIGRGKTLRNAMNK